MKLFVESAYLSSLLSAIYIALLYRSHRYRRPPIAPLLVAFTMGMLAVIPVVLIYRLVPGLHPDGMLGAVAIAPWLEEAVKLLLFLTMARRLGYPTLIEPLDYAILFGVLGVGFSVYEDFWYIFGGSYPSWISGDVGRFSEVFRWLIYARSFPGHLLFDAVAGFLIGWGMCGESERARANRRWSIVGAFAVAVAMHTGFNLAAHARGTLLLWSVVVLYVGLFLAFRRRALERSPFAALQALLAGDATSWGFPVSPVQVLFAEGFDWPGRVKSRILPFYPLTLSLVVLFPVLVSCVYLLHRLLSMGVQP